MIKIFSLILMFILPMSLFGWKMESGTVALPATTTGSSTWYSVTLQHQYDAPPLVFALTSSESNPYVQTEKPAALRIRNITATGFEIVQVEPLESSMDTNGSHPALTIHYIAIDPGVHYFPDNTMVIAGDIDTSKVANNYESVTFTSSFDNTPAVISMIQSLNNEENTLPGEPTKPLLTTAIRNVSTGGMELSLERSKLTEGNITTDEKIGYLAIEGGIQGIFTDSASNSILYETIITPQEVNGWDDGCDLYTYSNTYLVVPNLLANKNTRGGGHGGWLRQCSNTMTQAGVTIDEDIYGGSTDRTHPVSEIVGIVVMSGDFVVELTDIEANDDHYMTRSDTSFIANMLHNDTGDTLTAAIDTGPSHGSLSGTITDGSFTYTPDSGYVGSDSFTYTINGGIMSATVYITVLDGSLVAEYRLDECDFDETTGDVVDNTINRLSGTTRNGTTSNSIGKICKAVSFDGIDDDILIAHNDKFNFDPNVGFTVLAWVYLTGDNEASLVSKMSGIGDDDGWDLEIYDGDIYFDINGWADWAHAPQPTPSNAWHQIVGVYNPNKNREIILYVNGSEVDSESYNKTFRNATNDDLTIGSGGVHGYTENLNGSIDEVKIFNRPLTSTEISDIYDNESAGHNWDNDIDERVCNICQCTLRGASGGASNLVSLAADFRNMSDTSISSVITGDLASHSYGDSGNDWQIARRDYNVGTNNDAYYSMLGSNSDTLDYGKAYWIRNRTSNDINYSASLKSMDFNVTIADYPSCRSSNGKCTLVDLVSPNGTNNHGPYIYTMTGFPISKSIYWGNVRVLIDGVSYTPDQAEALGETFSATIWKYNGTGTTWTNSYINVTPGIPGVDNTIDPCVGYWIELDKGAAGKKVQLLIPQE